MTEAIYTERLTFRGETNDAKAEIIAVLDQGDLTAEEALKAIQGIGDALANLDLGKVRGESFKLQEHASSTQGKGEEGTKQREERPNIICLIGSTRFIETFAIKTWELELEGNIVLGCTLLPTWYSLVPHHFAEAQGVKEQRDEHHLKKIDLADEVLVLNVGGYIGESTRNEISYAEKAGKPIKYLEPTDSPAEEGKGND